MNVEKARKIVELDQKIQSVRAAIKILESCVLDTRGIKLLLGDDLTHRISSHFTHEEFENSLKSGLLSALRREDTALCKQMNELTDEWPGPETGGYVQPTESLVGETGPEVVTKNIAVTPGRINKVPERNKTDCTYHYFRQSGKWYASERGVVPKIAMGDMSLYSYRDLVRYHNRGTMPGLGGTGEEFFVFVVPDDDVEQQYCVPRMLRPVKVLGGDES